jgi:hypothetical protein
MTVQRYRSPGEAAQESAHNALVVAIAAARTAYDAYFESLDNNAPREASAALWQACIRADSRRFAAEARIAAGVRDGWPEVARRDAEASSPRC